MTQIQHLSAEFHSSGVTLSVVPAVLSKIQIGQSVIDALVWEYSNSRLL